MDESRPSSFNTTRWSLIRASATSPGDQRAALEWLCRSYWQPLYRHARLRGCGHEEALDATQGLFARLLAGERFATLEEVVEHYSTRQKRSATLDPNLAKHPDGGVRLSDNDKRALVAFLKTLTDEKYVK